MSRRVKQLQQSEYSFDPNNDQDHTNDDQQDFDQRRVDSEDDEDQGYPSNEQEQQNYYQQNLDKRGRGREIYHRQEIQNPKKANNYEMTKKKPLAVISMDIGETSDEIIVYNLEDIGLLAQNFCHQHQLDLQCVDFIVENIQKELERQQKLKTSSKIVPTDKIEERSQHKGYLYPNSKQMKKFQSLNQDSEESSHMNQNGRQNFRPIHNLGDRDYETQNNDSVKTSDYESNYRNTYSFGKQKPENLKKNKGTHKQIHQRDDDSLRDQRKFNQSYGRITDEVHHQLDQDPQSDEQQYEQERTNKKKRGAQNSPLNISDQDEEEENNDQRRNVQTFGKQYTQSDRDSYISRQSNNSQQSNEPLQQNNKHPFSENDNRFVQSNDEIRSKRYGDQIDSRSQQPSSREENYNQRDEHDYEQQENQYQQHYEQQHIREKYDEGIRRIHQGRQQQDLSQEQIENGEEDEEEEEIDNRNQQSHKSKKINETSKNKPRRINTEEEFQVEQEDYSHSHTSRQHTINNRKKGKKERERSMTPTENSDYKNNYLTDENNSSKSSNRVQEKEIANTYENWQKWIQEKLDNQNEQLSENSFSTPQGHSQKISQSPSKNSINSNISKQQQNANGGYVNFGFGDKGSDYQAGTSGNFGNASQYSHDDPTNIYQQLYKNAMQTFEIKRERDQLKAVQDQEKLQKELQKMFRPDISPESIKLAENQQLYKNEKIQDQLLREGQVNQELQYKAVLVQELEQSAECTFNPYVSEESKQIVENQRKNNTTYQYPNDSKNTSQVSSSSSALHSDQNSNYRQNGTDNQFYNTNQSRNRSSEKSQSSNSKLIIKEIDLSRAQSQGSTFHKNHSQENLGKNGSTSTFSSLLKTNSSKDLTPQKLGISNSQNPVAQAVQTQMDEKSDIQSQSKVEHKFLFERPIFEPHAMKQSASYIQVRKPKTIYQEPKKPIHHESSKYYNANPLKIDQNLRVKIQLFVFDPLDSDQDGQIDASNTELNYIDSNLLEIIQDVLFQMEEKEEVLTFEKFLKKICILNLLEPLVKVLKFMKFSFQNKNFLQELFQIQSQIERQTEIQLLKDEQVQRAYRDYENSLQQRSSQKSRTYDSLQSNYPENEEDVSFSQTSQGHFRTTDYRNHLKQ